MGVLTKEEFEKSLKENGFDEGDLDEIRQRFKRVLVSFMVITGPQSRDYPRRTSLLNESIQVLINLKRSLSQQMAMELKSLLEQNLFAVFLNPKILINVPIGLCLGILKQL